MTNYKLKLADKWIEGSQTRDSQVRTFKIQIEEEQPGLSYATSRAIAKSLGDKSKADQHPFSFAGPEDVRVEIEPTQTHFIFSSFKSTPNGYDARKASQFVVGFADKKLWNQSEFEAYGTKFQLLTPKQSAQIDGGPWEKAIRRLWPLFLNRFGKPTDHLVFVDLQGPISGGPLGENVLGFFATDNVSANLHSEMQANLGWAPQKSTRDYVKTHYPKSNNQWDEYLLGTFAHEIAHLYFGFGVTREKVKSVEELWFSLGLGMIYDMEITSELVGRPPQLEVDLINNWKNNISTLKDVDQRLIAPNNSADSKYKFDRKKVFAHGKAAFFLGELRSQIGKHKFDKAVLEYLRECGGCVHGYSDFKKFLGKNSKVADALEVKYGVR
jgi:hypothetical protein